MVLSITSINQQFVYIGGSNFALDNIDNKNKIRRIYSFSGSNNSNVLRWTPNDPFSQFAFLEPNKVYWIESLAANFENYEIDNIEANEVSISFNITGINQFLKYDCETGYSLNNLDLSIKQKIRRIYTFTGANNSSISRWSPNDLFSQFLFFEPNKVYWVESLSENFTPYSLLEGCEPTPPMFEDSANYNQQANWNNTTSGNLTTAGSNGGPSAYHTYDQSGNVYEWNDLDDNTGPLRGLRGGSWNSTDVFSLSSASRLTDNPSLSNNTIGFRVASSSFHKNFIDSLDNSLTSYSYVSDKELFIDGLDLFNWCNVDSNTTFTLWTHWRPTVAANEIPFNPLDSRILYRSVVRSSNTNLNTFYSSIGCSLFTNLYEKLSSSVSISSILASKLFIYTLNNPHYLVATLGSTSIICQPYIPSIFLNPINDFVFIKDKINNNDINNYGNVDHYYSIGKHPVTNCEYVNFLNSVDPEGLNPQNIYNSDMSNSANGGIDFFPENIIRKKYKLKNNMDSKPVVYVSWFSAARYCNWLSSGKQLYETTDNTEYAPQNFNIYSVGTDIEGDAIAKDLEFLSYNEFGNELAQQYIPTENEWYKAAFYKGGETNAGYWLYSTQSDILPEPVNSDEFGNGLINENPANNSDHLCAICIRSPFSKDCCESRQSSSNTVLTFTGPRTRRIPPLVDKPTKVTVTGITDSEILIHGVSFGSTNNPTETHVIDHTFFMCNDTFNIESVPCGSNFVNLNVVVCWEESFIENETLDYSGCSDITVLMSSCDCVTTLRYSGDKSTNFCMIDSSSDDHIVINDPIDVVSCSNYILTGTNLGNNEISSIINDPPPAGAALNIIKTGSGKWILSGLNTYSGQLRVLDGTLVIGATVGLSVSGPFGEATSTALLPVVGSSAASTTGFAALLSAGFLVNRGFSVAKSGPGSTQTVIIGGVGTGTATFSDGHSIRLGRDVTLQASTGGTAVFASTWQNLDGGNDPNVAFTVGSPGNTGTVVFSSIIPDSITLFDVFPGATAKLDSGEETIYRETPVILGVSSTLDLNGTDQPLESLEMRGSATVTEGVLRTLDKIKAVGSENLIASDVIINAATTIDVSGSLTISGDVSGSSDLIKTGSGTLSLTGTLSYTGATNINAGTLEVESLVSGPPKISSSIFTPTTLIVEFTTIPLSNEQYRLLPGSTVQTYNSVILNNAGLATGTYNSATSTLEIN